MKALISTACFLVMLTAVRAADSYFLSHPSLTPDGKHVVFSFEGDLWKADIGTGQAYRLTAMQGYETHARVSPDGKWIAFTGRQFGNADIFIMPVNGGEIRQLTWHSANDEVCSWSWDSRSVYFSSNRMGNISGYRVPVSGGTAERVFGDHFFLYDHLLAEHPQTGEIFFNDTWESSFQEQRKRYRGAFNPDIQSYHPATGKYRRYTDWDGKDFAATLDRNGRIYFVSDEKNGEYNLYTFIDGKKTALTSFNSSIRNPQVNAAGGKVVFERDYQLWIYDIASGKAEKLKLSLYRNSILAKERDFNVKDAITAFDISPDGKKMAFISRGELFVSDIEGKFVQQIARGNAERAREVKWLADNRTLLFNQTSDGYLNLYTISANGSGGMKKLTGDRSNNRLIELNEKRTMAVYLSGREELRLLDLKTLASRTLVRDEIWGFFNSRPRFSPDDEYIIFTAYRNFEQDIFLHHLKRKTTVNLTQTAITEAEPLWSPDGRYIYFHSSRLKPSYPFGLSNPKIYRVALEKLDLPYRIDKFNELFTEKDSAAKDTARIAPPVPPAAAVMIDMDRIMERLEQIGPEFGAQLLSAVYRKGDKTMVFYRSNHGEGKNALWKTVMEPFDPIKTDRIAGTEGVAIGEIVIVKDKLFLLAGGKVHKLNTDQNKAEPLSISHIFRRNLMQEFVQIFDEAWAQVEENFYDENFHGVNWAGMKDKYRRFLPFLNSRADLRVLLNDMLGELNSSHQGFFTSGEDELVPLKNLTMETGVLFDSKSPYRVRSVVARSSADRKGVDIRPGDILVKVNDMMVDHAIDRDYYFTRPSLDQELRLTFTRNGRQYHVQLHPQPSLYSNLYEEWIDANQKRVDELGRKRIAYACMKNMGTAELDNFIIDMTRELTERDALILDIRYNTGGNVHDEVLRFLSQRSYLQWKYREGAMTRQSNFAPADKPIVLLINEQSLSDAEMTAEGFRKLKLGRIIGNETYRWIIFTSGSGMVDGSFVRMPSWGCYSLEGEDLEMSGVQPDIRVINSFSDKVNGRDPQLDRAIEEIMSQLK